MFYVSAYSAAEDQNVKGDGTNRHKRMFCCDEIEHMLNEFVVLRRNGEPLETFRSGVVYVMNADGKTIETISFMPKVEHTSQN